MELNSILHRNIEYHMLKKNATVKWSALILLI